MAIRLPEPLRKSLSVLASANQRTIDELVEHLKRLPPQVPAEDLPDKLAVEVKNLPSAESRPIFESLISLAAYKGSSNTSTDKVVSDVIAALKTPGDKEPALAPELIDRLSERLPLFLNLGPLTVSSKAFGVLTDNQRILRAARVLSDIRAVFLENVETMPAAAVIIHELKLEYSESGRRQEWFIALDSKDLQNLIDVLERAKRKDNSLRSVLATAKLPFLEPR